MHTTRAFPFHHARQTLLIGHNTLSCRHTSQPPTCNSQQPPRTKEGGAREDAAFCPPWTKAAQSWPCHSAQYLPVPQGAPSLWFLCSWEDCQPEKNPVTGETLGPSQRATELSLLPLSWVQRNETWQAPQNLLPRQGLLRGLLPCPPPGGSASCGHTPAAAPARPRRLRLKPGKERSHGSVGVSGEESHGIAVSP